MADVEYSIPEDVIRGLNDKDRQALINSKTPEEAIRNFSPEGIDLLANYKPKAKPSNIDDAETLMAKHLTFGAAPAAAGLGAAAGDASVNPPSLGTLFRAMLNNGKIAKQDYPEVQHIEDAGMEGRKERQMLEDEAAQRSPNIDKATMIGSALLTAPLTAVKGLNAVQKLENAGRIGLAIGTANALGRADNLEDAGQRIAGTGLANVFLNGAGQVASAGAGKLADATEGIRDAAGNFVTKATGGLGHDAVMAGATHLGGIKGAIIAKGLMSLLPNAEDEVAQAAAPSRFYELSAKALSGQSTPSAPNIADKIMSAYSPANLGNAVKTSIGTSAIQRKLDQLKGGQ